MNRLQTLIYNKSIIAFVLIYLHFFAVNGQSDSSNGEIKSMLYADVAYNSTIKTIQLHESAWEYAPAMIQLNTEQTLTLEFDDLEADLKTLNYTVIHCNSDWTPTDLSPNEYLQGFTDDYIREYNYSVNSIQKYTHYRLTFPNSNIRMTKSGNYIIKVYQDNDPEKLILTRRFLVYEVLIGINAIIKQATNVDDRFYKQEIDFTIQHNNYPLSNPFDLKVVLMQNNRWDNISYKLKPLYIKGDVLEYDYDTENVFNGGNEFRFFDTRTIRLNTERVANVEFKNKEYHVTLHNDEKRSYKRYSFYQDLNGKFAIKNQEGTDDDIQSEYTFVHFFINTNGPLNGGNVFVFGALSNWSCTNENRMTYNPNKLGYECVLYLKQGYYNYEYVFVDEKDKIVDETIIEGTRFETENEYAIFAYYRPIGLRYDQLIGMRRFSSTQEQR